MFSRDFQILEEANSKRMLSVNDERSIKECLREEYIYIELIQGYSQNEAFLNNSIRLIEATENSIGAKQEAIFVILNCNDNSLIEELLSKLCSNSLNIPFQEKISLLIKNKQILIIQFLLKIDNKKSRSFAGKCILSNGYSEFTKRYHDKKQIFPTLESSVAYAILCRLGSKETIKLVENAFEASKHPIIKEKIALELIFTGYQKAIEYIKDFNSIHSFQISPFICLKDESELYKNKLIEELANLNDESQIDSFMNYFAMAVLWYGNPILIPFLIDMLNERSITLHLHEILLRFFEEEDPHMRDAYSLVYEWGEFDKALEDKFSDYHEDDSEEKYSFEFEQKATDVQKRIIAFWHNNSSYINQSINYNQKYYTYHPFSIPEIWNESINTPLVEQQVLVHKGIQLLVGEYLIFDPYALLSIKLKQHRDIMKLLLTNKEKIVAGKWTKKY